MTAVASGNVFPKHIVEGAFGSLVGQMKVTLDCCFFADDYGISKDVKQIDNIKATYAICKQECRDLIVMLEVYTDASLSEKHMLCRRLVREFLEQLEECKDIVSAKAAHNRHVVAFAESVTSFLVTIHSVLHTDTESVDRRKLTSEYCRECLGSVREWPGKSSAAGMILDISAEST